MKLPKLYSRRSDGKVQVWEKEVIKDKHRSHSGIMDGKIVISEWTVAEADVRWWNSNGDSGRSAEESAVEEAKAEWQKKKDKGYTEDIKDVDEKTFFEPMLAKVWQDYKDEVSFPVYVQPKLDGLRLIARKDGLWTRNGKEYKSIPHIYEALKSLFKYNPKYIFDGEVYADKFANDFNKICSLAKKSKPTKEDIEESAKSIEYHIYDFPFWDGIFSERMEQLTKVLTHCDSDKIKMVVTHKATSHVEVDKYYGEFVEDGYEGLMVRLDEKYENKRTKVLLKYKEFQDAEYEILRVIEGDGNRSGGAGAFVCKNNDGSEFRTNIKGTREFCKEILNSPNDYIGKMATIKFFNFTPAGVPRFPYFMRLRDE